MEMRVRVLLGAAIGVAALFLVYNIFYKPWIEKKRKLDAEIVKTKRSLSVAKAYLSRRSVIETDWKKIETDVRDPQRPALKSGFESYIRMTFTDQTIQDNGRLPTVTPKDQAEQVGDFAEWIVDAKGARFRIAEFREFLYRLAVAKDFVKVRTLTLVTKDEEQQVDFGISTIEYSPVVTRSKP